MNKETIKPAQAAQQETRVKTRQTLFKEREKLYLRYKLIQHQVDANTKKRTDEVATRKIRVATKKRPRNIEQKYKNYERENLNLHTTHTAWVQTLGKPPRIPRNDGFAFVPNLLIYGSCIPSRLSKYVACRSAQRTGLGLQLFWTLKNQTRHNIPCSKKGRCQEKINSSSHKIAKEKKTRSKQDRSQEEI